jgi:carboxymethylenebutenolidase
MDDLTGLIGLREFPLPRRGVIMTSLISGFTLATTRVEARAIHTDAAGLDAGEASVPTKEGNLPAYYAKPSHGTDFPVILVNEEIFGVHEYIKDVCRRLAKLGYFAVATEYYARIGDLSKMTDVSAIIRDVISKEPDAQYMSDLDSTAAWAAAHGGSATKLGVIGFCRGGRQTWLYAAHNPTLKAAVAFYGPVMGTKTDIQPRTVAEIADQIKCPLLGLYGAKDPGIAVDDVRAAEAKAKAAGKSVDIVVYPDAGHGFHADYRPSYRQADADDGWKRAIAWFQANGLGASA